MSERHRRRHNWEGVVLSTRVERQKTFQRQRDAVRLYLRDVFFAGIARARVDQGVDEWETEGGTCREWLDSTAEQGCTAEGVDGVDESTNRTRIVLHTVNGGTARDEYLQALRRGEFRGTSSGVWEG